jgi:cell surface protein SprA
MKLLLLPIVLGSFCLNTNANPTVGFRPASNGFGSRNTLPPSTLSNLFAYITALKSVPPDTVPLRDRTGDFLRDSIKNPFNLKDPSIIEKSVEYDPVTNRYYLTEKIGSDFFRTPTVMTFEEYVQWKAKQQEKEYFDRLAGINRGKQGERVDPISKIDFSQTQDNKIKMLLGNDLTKKLDPVKMKADIGDKLINQIFGGTGIDIRPQGNIDLTFGGDYRRYDNPILPIRARSTGGLLFDMNINFNVTGKIGEKLNLNTAFNNKAQFDFDRIIKLNYNTNQFSEDDIVKSIEAGNVSLPLRGTLIQGSQNLFGLKTTLQFGYLKLTALGAQQQSRRQTLNLQGGASVQQFAVQADQYDENRHFFLTHFNRNTFEGALSELPQIKSLFTIKDIEVWVTNKRNDDREVRQIVAFADMGEGDRLTSPQNIRLNNTALDITNTFHLPDNSANDLYSRLNADDNNRRLNVIIGKLETSFGLLGGRDFMKVSAKKLSPTEYTFNPQLGTLSVNNVDRDQVLAVAFTYYYNGHGPNPANPNEPFRVGDLSGDRSTYFANDSTSKVLFTKMLKTTAQITDVPLWDLMMKNVYAINAYVNNPQDFNLEVFYQDPGKDRADKRFLSESGLNTQPLIRLLNLDRINTQGDPQPDGRFDFISGVTINPRNGRIMFPVLEPFGSSLRKRILELTGSQATADKYTYDSLYRTTLFRAQEAADKNRFILRGSAKSSISSDISLGAFNLKPGSIRVNAGGRPLTEGIDYEVNYGIGTLKVLNPAYLSPDLPLSISFEDNTLFGFQTRLMVGLRADYSVKKNFNIGATYLNLFEQPFTRKVNVGDDPIDNKIYGLDMNFTEDAPWLTKLVDKLPLISTKEPSKITFTAEAAYLKPGYAKAIKDADGTNTSAVYIDDFEGSTSPFSLMSGFNSWALASVPQRNPLFPETKNLADPTTIFGVNRARLSWFFADNYVREQLHTKFKDQAGKDPYLNPYTTFIPVREVFPNRDAASAFELSSLRTFDIHYSPKTRGPYNFDEKDPIKRDNIEISKGLESDGRLKAPTTRWAGIMRGLTNTDFEAANIEYMDFWMLDPTINDTERKNGGQLLLHIGEISEDILKDSRRSYENGLKSPRNLTLNEDTTRWGKIPRTELNLPNAFDSDPAVRLAQDVGLDGINDANERIKFKPYLDRMAGYLNPAAFASMENDPSNDDFLYYNDASLENSPLLDRYLSFNSTEGNSRADNDQTVQSSTNWPDTEDVNHDNTFDENEAYYQYEIPIAPASNKGLKSNKYIVESIADPTGARTWYHFRVPLQDFDKKYGQIQGFRNIRFIRMIVRGFEDSVTMRFAKLDLVRNQWRRFRSEQTVAGATINRDDNTTTLETTAVNIEENGKRPVFNYVLPPGVVRQEAIGAYTQNARQNEQSLSMRICNLPANKAKSIFKLVQMDMRMYDRLRMFVHAEDLKAGNARPQQRKSSVFMRVGSDFVNNYYEYEIPLTMSDPTTIAGLSNNTAQYANEVWKAENAFDFPLALLASVKERRNVARSPLDSIYEIFDPQKVRNKVKVKGNPNIGLVKGFMVGVYNYDDVDLCTELWINELRVSGLNEEGAGAALARMDVKLADFGNVTVSGTYTGVGYGGLEQKVQQRSREQILGYDVSGTFELSKMLPHKWGVHLPFYVQRSHQVRTPQFDPYDLDLTLKSKLSKETDATKQDSIRDNAITQTKITSYSLTNVRKDRTNTTAKPKPWDIENFSASYAYTRTEKSDPLVSSDAKDAYRGGLDYNYSREAYYVEPFKKLIKNDKYLKLLSQFNFNPFPNTIGVNTLMDRQVAQTTFRFAGEDPQYNTYFNRRFTWDRNYNVQWDLTRSLKFTLDAKNMSVIDELPDFALDGTPASEQAKKDKIYQNLQDLGRTKRYDQTMNLSYTLPFKYMPFMDWITIRATYASTYGWEAMAQVRQGNSFIDNPVGNNIKNTQNRQINADFNFDNLYNYVPYLKRINTPRLVAPSEGGKTKAKKRGRGKSGEPTAEPPTETDEGKMAAEKAAKLEKGKKGKKDPNQPYEPSLGERIVIRPLMTLRKGRFNYSEQFNSFVPGFTPQAGLFGQQNLNTPGWGYVTGWQQPTDEWLDVAARNRYISSDLYQTRPVLAGYTQNADARLTLEPFTDFQVTVEANRVFTKNHTQEFRDTTPNDRIVNLVHTAVNDAGSFTTSFFAANTIFKATNDSTLFAAFMSNRSIVSQTLGANARDYPDKPGYKEGYGPLNRDVLVASFLASYTGTDPAKMARTNLFKILPQLNWRLNYNGLTKLAMFRDIFQSLNLTHGYKSTLTVNQYVTNGDYSVRNPKQFVKENQDQLYDYYPEYRIPAIVINEQFSPLLGLDAQLKSGMRFGVNYKKSRNLALTLGDTRLSESKATEITVSFGHTMKNVHIPFLMPKQIKPKKPKKGQKADDGGVKINLGDPNDPQGKKKVGNDLKLDFSLSWNDRITQNRELGQGSIIPSSGSKALRLSPSASYTLNANLDLRLFFDYNKTIPYTTAAFNNVDARGGVTVTFKLK